MTAGRACVMPIPPMHQPTPTSTFERPRAPPRGGCRSKVLKTDTPLGLDESCDERANTLPEPPPRRASLRQIPTTFATTVGRLRKGGGITLGTHTVGAGVEEVLSTGDPILVGTACGPAVLRAHPSESIDAACAEQTSVKRDPLQGQKRPTICGLLRACLGRRLGRTTSSLALSSLWLHP